MKQKHFRYLCRDMGYFVSRPPPHTWFWVRSVSCTQFDSRNYWRISADQVRRFTPDTLEQALFTWTFTGLKPANLL
jgi:hypothetical protein